MVMMPMISNHFATANTPPSSLFNHPSMMSSITFSSSLPIRVSATIAMTNIIAKAATFSVCSEPDMNCASH